MGKGVKSCGKVYSSLYIEYIIYKGKQRCGKKVAGKVSAGKGVSSFVYSIIEIKNRAGQR